MLLCLVEWTEAITLKAGQYSENMKEKDIKRTRENTQSMTNCLWIDPCQKGEV